MMWYNLGSSLGELHMALEVAAEMVPLVVTPDGVVRISGTRVRLETVVAAFVNGATAEEIVQQYSTLTLADTYAVISYYLRHRGEVDSYLETRKQESQKIRLNNESRHDPQGIRERLLARGAAIP